LAKAGEVGFLGPNRSPRLVPLAPLRPGAPVMVVSHGIGGDPCNQEILIKEAQARGNQVYVMCYDTYSEGGSTLSDGFARELKGLGASGVKDVTVVAHSLGALTMKAALAKLAGSDGKVQGFDHIRYVALSAPWGGVNVANAALWLLTGSPQLAFARDLAPGSAYWQGLIETPIPGNVDFYNVQGDMDQFSALAWGKQMAANRQAVLAEAKRTLTLPRGTHNSPMWDPASLDFIFDPEHAPAPAGPADTMHGAIAREVIACLGKREAFRPK
ncbi:MAG: hypothetical protein JWM80_4935, partial [Cyanobacteria bacterium RYN_339]|nr:hypothetical protein [Cyanobacteria bacterium RYN_339]